jgi:hypothetical protein
MNSTSSNTSTTLPPPQHPASGTTTGQGVSGSATGTGSSGNAAAQGMFSPKGIPWQLECLLIGVGVGEKIKGGWNVFHGTPPSLIHFSPVL